MKKRLFAGLLAGVLAVGMLTGCGGSSQSAASSAAPETEAESAAAETAAAETTAASGDMETITVAATPAPHAELLEKAKPLMAEKGYDLQIKVFDDYVQPNEVVESGEIDANYFQHVAYLNSFNEERGTHLVNAGGIHYEPLGLYPGKKASLDEIAEGDEIVVPNDTTNEARALLLLQEAGLITLKEGVGINATVLDIVDNPKGLSFNEMNAAGIPNVIKDSAYVVMNGNYAIQAGYSASKDALFVESGDSEAIQMYVNIIAVKEGNENLDKVKALVEVLRSDEIKNYINETYNGSVVVYEE